MNKNELVFPNEQTVKRLLSQLQVPYRFVSHLGGGEFSNVFLVKHPETEQPYALKIMDYQFLLQRLKKEDPADFKAHYREIQKRFISEANFYKKIQHPGVVHILETGVLTDQVYNIEVPYFIMSYIRGVTLAELLKKESPMDLEQALSITRDVLGALEIIHRNNIIHRDLKPSNIMIEEGTGKGIIIDFGIAKDVLGGTCLTTTGTFLGSPLYMAPEQCIDSRKVCPASDIYAYGAVLYKMLTGKPPFEGGSHLEVMSAHRDRPIPDIRQDKPGLPPALHQVLTRAMAKSPDQRFPTAGDFLHHLDRAVKNTPPSAPKRTFVAIAAAGAAMIILVLFFLLRTPSQTGKPAPPPKPAPSPFAAFNKDYQSLRELLDSRRRKEKKLRACEKFISKYAGDIKKIGTPEWDRLEEIKQREELLVAAIKANEYRHQAQKALSRDNVSKAIHYEKKAIEIMLSGRVTKLEQDIRQKELRQKTGQHDPLLQQHKKKPTLETYLTIREKMPGANLLPGAKARLLEDHPNLPPETYWTKSIKPNPKGYYEHTFANGHRMIYIPQIKAWIDKFEVSNRQYRVTFPGGAAGDGKSSAGSSQYIDPGDTYPAAVTYREAEAYCKAHGFRLPTAAQWETAAGKGQSRFPWGDDPPGQNNRWPANFESWEDGFEGTAPVDSFKNFTSPCGALNMAGNVWEWVQGKMLKGGGFFSSQKDLLIENTVGGREKNKEGFRCLKEE